MAQFVIQYDLDGIDVDYEVRTTKFYQLELIQMNWLL